VFGLFYSDICVKNWLVAFTFNRIINMATFIPAPSSSDFSTVPSFESAPFVSGFELAVTGNTTLTVQPGMARALTSSQVIAFPSYSASIPGSVTVDISTVGQNGCSPVSISSLGLTYNTLFPLYVCFDSSGTAVNSSNSSVSGPGFCFVVATGNNFLPEGFDSFRRIGWVPVSQATGYVLKFAQQGNGNEREYLYQDPVTLLTAGNATTPTEVKLSYQTGLVPFGQVGKVNLNVALTGNAAGSYVYLEPYGLTAASRATTVLGTTTAGQILAANVDMVYGLDAAGDAAITYLVDNGSSAVTIYLAGFTDSLNNSLV